MIASQTEECFDLADLHRAQLRLSREMRPAQTLESCARAVCSVLYEELGRGGSNAMESRCALVRCFKSHPFGALAPALSHQQVARDSAVPGPETRCLALLASQGDLPEWCSRHTSRRHRLIPIPDRRALERMPMLRELFRQFDVDVHEQGPHFLSVTSRSSHAYDVFHIEEALGSAHVPDQEQFVRPFGIRSVVGFGGPLRRGELYAVLLFCKRHVSSDVARQLRHVALDVTARFFQFDDAAVFDPLPA